MVIRVIHEDEFSTVTYDVERRLIVYKRLAKSYPTLEAAAESVRKARERMPPGMPLEHHVFLMDVREGPMRSDEGFEQTMRVTGPELSTLFKRSAVLVKTAVGKLQMNRIQKERGGVSTVFDDERAALAYLLGA
jgi:hypothetical protein